MISIQSLSKSYGKVAVLKDINLEINGGQVHGIVGRNGAGKTTLFNCLAGIEQYKGNIEYSEGPLREESAYLQTRPYIMSHITGHEYLRLVANAKGIKALDEQIVNLFELPLERYAKTYSTGMQKKLALTGMLLQQNKVFLLDEPFNGVDLESNLIIQALITRMQHLGKIVIISSHIFQTLQKSCDIIHHLEDGEIARSFGKAEFDQVEKELSSKGTSGKISSLHL
jgi:ABC-2 type transport system ATP-binding protein